VTLLEKMIEVLLPQRRGTLKNVSNVLSNPQRMVEEAWEEKRGALDLKPDGGWTSLNWDLCHDSGPPRGPNKLDLGLVPQLCDLMGAEQV
jgi:hypothetical protein